MKKALMITGVVLIFGGFLLLSNKPITGPDPDAEVVTEEADAAKATYLGKAEMEIQDLTSKVKMLEEQSKQRGVKTRAEFDRQVTETKIKLENARLKVAELKASSTGAWQTLRQSVEEALVKVKADYQKSKTYFNKQDKTKPKAT